MTLLRATALAATLVLSTLTAAHAQRGGPGRGGETSFFAADAEPISRILEFATELDLTDGQRTALMNIRRALRRANEPWLRRVDSIADVIGLGPPPERPTAEYATKLARLDSIAKPITDSIRVSNDSAQVRARAVLDSVQVTRLDSILRTGAGRRGRRPTGLR